MHIFKKTRKYSFQNFATFHVSESYQPSFRKRNLCRWLKKIASWWCKTTLASPPTMPSPTPLGLAKMPSTTSLLQTPSTWPWSQWVQMCRKLQLNQAFFGRMSGSYRWLIPPVPWVFERFVEFFGHFVEFFGKFIEFIEFLATLLEFLIFLYLFSPKPMILFTFPSFLWEKDKYFYSKRGKVLR